MINNHVDAPTHLPDTDSPTVLIYHRASLNIVL